MVTKTAQRISLSVPPQILRSGKRLVRYPRYYAGIARARWSYMRGDWQAKQPYLFIAGLPKAGTSWIESMLAHYPGYTLIAHPEITIFDYEHAGTHHFELPTNFFTRLGRGLYVIKVHCHWSPNNARVLAEAGIRYCVLYRDLRDAAVSHVAYVKRTPWHPEYPAYRNMTMKEGLLHFAATLLPEWARWIDSWKANRDASKSLELTYEQMLADTRRSMIRVAELFELPTEPIAEIVKSEAFVNVKNRGSFFRKGSAGDWRNHFDAELRQVYKPVLADALVRWGYERDTGW